MTATEAPELVRLRVLWFALRARGLDAAAAPGIAYDRPRVQSSPERPAVPHGYGLGHARDPVSVRLASLAGTEAAVTLHWYRSYDATGAWASGSVEAILDACVRGVASQAQLAAWAASARSAELGARATQAHVTAAGRAWARARMARAWAAWQSAEAEAS